ncbi:hypothetical protein AQUCO_01500450v1 [Aquilegia coerulea]|uniref:Glyoxalase/fosfomycin resistance/dioxygenase domain-containing protein n=1 Tax=Aquilegia coerulea TaxID=218851 RepID=A0A2G5DTU5_AQUCA|nr:hypothetical protein AQUCO_01500450v1 [Aquilegia coerulea]
MKERKKEEEGDSISVVFLLSYSLFAFELKEKGLFTLISFTSLLCFRYQVRLSFLFSSSSPPSFVASLFLGSVHLPSPLITRWVMQLHKDVPRAARFYSEGLDFSIKVCTLRWAELESGPLKLALMQSNSDHDVQKGYSSHLSFTVTDINNTVTKLMSLGAELDGPIKYEIHGKVAAVRMDGHMLGLYEPA